MNEQAIDYSRKWYVMAAVAMGIFLSTIDGSIVNVALPTLTRYFGTNFATVQWVVLAYLLAIATLMLSIGRLADMIGKKPLYTTGFVIFTLSSMLCGLAPTIYWLIAFRVIQAIGGALILALGLAIITESFPASERGKALGISGAVVSVGIVIGPTLGGFLIDSFSWRWIFYVNVPVGIAGTLMAWRYVPHINPPGGQHFDFWGAITLFVSLLSMLLALTLGQNMGFADPRILLLLASFTLSLVLFIIIELRIDQPMIDLRLFRNSYFSVSLITGFITFIAIAGTIMLLPFYLENVLGYSTRQVGLLLAVVPIGLGISAPLSGSLSDRLGTRPITVAGLGVLLLGYYALSTLTANTTATGFLLRFLPIGVGMGIFQSPNNSAIMGSAPAHRLGIVSGMLAFNRTLGQTTGIALLGALWAGRVIFYAGESLSGGATEGSPGAQANGLQDTFLAMTIAIGLALLLALWAFFKHRRDQSARERDGIIQPAA
jgi:EmrB/QacA subfamily drug resistance transporter